MLISDCSATATYLATARVVCYGAAHARRARYDDQWPTQGDAHRQRELPGSAERSFLPRLHRSVGKIFLLWNDGAARPLHGESVVAARTCRAHRWIFWIPCRGGIGRRPALNPGARFADFRALLRFRLLHAAARRHDRRSLDRTTQCCRDWRSLDECRSYSDDL